MTLNGIGCVHKHVQLHHQMWWDKLQFHCTVPKFQLLYWQQGVPQPIDKHWVCCLDVMVIVKEMLLVVVIDNDSIPLTMIPVEHVLSSQCNGIVLSTVVLEPPFHHMAVWTTPSLIRQLASNSHNNSTTSLTINTQDGWCLPPTKQLAWLHKAVSWQGIHTLIIMIPQGNVWIAVAHLHHTFLGMRCVCLSINYPHHKHRHHLFHSYTMMIVNSVTITTITITTRASFIIFKGTMAQEHLGAKNLGAKTNGASQ